MISRSSKYVFITPLLAVVSHLVYLLSPFYSVKVPLFGDSLRTLAVTQADGFTGFTFLASLSIIGLCGVFTGALCLGVTDWAYQRIVIISGAVISFFLPLYARAYYVTHNDEITFKLHWGALFYTILILATIVFACIIRDDISILEETEELIDEHTYGASEHFQAATQELEND
jgi:Na+-transporting NADH:ubiquinone oxidoreductase subunit NqrB